MNPYREMEVCKRCKGSKLVWYGGWDGMGGYDESHSEPCPVCSADLIQPKKDEEALV